MRKKEKKQMKQRKEKKLKVGVRKNKRGRNKIFLWELAMRGRFSYQNDQ